MYISFARPIVYLSLVYSSPVSCLLVSCQADCVRRPIRLRPVSDQVASAVQSDCVRCPTVIPALVHCTNELKK